MLSAAMNNGVEGIFTKFLKEKDSKAHVFGKMESLKISSYLSTG